MKKRKVDKSSTCGICSDSDLLNRNDIKEALISCHRCKTSWHPSCLKFSDKLTKNILEKSTWLCADCRTCEVCNLKNKNGVILICDICDLGYHMHCHSPSVKNVPKGVWLCRSCSQIDHQNKNNKNKKTLKKTPQILKAQFSSPLKLSINNKLRALRFLEDGLSKYFSTHSKRRAVLRSTTSDQQQPSMMASKKKLEVVKKLAKLRGDRAEFLADGLSEFFKVRDEKRRSAYRSADLSTGDVQNSSEYETLKHLPNKKSTKTQHSAPSERRILSSHQANQSLKKAKSFNSKRRSTKMMVSGNCRLLTGLFDGLSHLYTTDGMRQRKSLHFYRDKHNRSKMKGKCLHNADSSIYKDSDMSSYFSSAAAVGCCATSPSPKRNKKENHPGPGSSVMKTSRNKTLLSGVEWSEDEGISGIPSQDCILFRKAVKKAAKILDQQDKPVEKQASKWPSFIEIGQYEVATWYSSPYPNEYSKCCKLYICEFCLKYMRSQETLSTHLSKCQVYHPPGEEVYHDGSLSVYEVDGNVNKSFCQNLCLLAKLYLQHKTLYHDVEPFLFYVLTTSDSRGCHIVGYFSKEKYCLQKYNLSCLMTLPQYQRQGYGRFLIEFSYLLSRKEGFPGSPEKPLSDLGKISYLSYWKSIIVEFIHCHVNDSELSVNDLSRSTGIAPEDVLSTLESLGMIGKLKDSYIIVVNKETLQEMFTSLELQRHICLNEEKLKWHPPVFQNYLEKID